MSRFIRPSLRLFSSHRKFAFGTAGLLVASSFGTIFTEENIQLKYRKEPSTGTTLPLEYPPLELLAMGMRQVTFLKVNVYCLGLYVHPKVLNGLKNVSIWQNLTEDEFESNEAVLDLWNRVKQAKSQLVFVVNPVRKTNTPHIMKGFVGGLGRMQNLEQDLDLLLDGISDEELKSVPDAIKEFKETFPKGELSPGDLLYAILDPNAGTIEIKLGNQSSIVRSSWLAKAFYWSYVNSGNASSQAFRKDLAKEMVERMALPLER